jgi:hypothetical protein
MEVRRLAITGDLLRSGLADVDDGQAVEVPRVDLVGELERRWELALAALRQLEDDYARFRAALPREMTKAERGQIRALAADLPALWGSPTTCAADRRAVVRLLIDRVELTRRGDTELVDVVVHWQGGAVGRYTVLQRVRGYQHLGQYGALRARVAELRSHGQTSTQIAAALNTEGFVMPRGEAFTACTVRRLCRQLGLAGRPAEAGGGRGAFEWWLLELASALGVARSVLYRWRRSGYVSARRRAGDQTQWIIWADAAEVRRLRRLRAHERAHRGAPAPAELITPIKRKVATSKRAKKKAENPPVQRGGS